MLTLIERNSDRLKADFAGMFLFSILLQQYISTRRKSELRKKKTINLEQPSISRISVLLRGSLVEFFNVTCNLFIRPRTSLFARKLRSKSSTLPIFTNFPNTQTSRSSSCILCFRKDTSSLCTTRKKPKFWCCLRNAKISSIPSVRHQRLRYRWNLTCPLFRFTVLVRFARPRGLTFVSYFPVAISHSASWSRQAVVQNFRHLAPYTCF